MLFSPLDLIGFLIFILLIFMLPWFLRVRALSSINSFAFELEEMVEQTKKSLIKICNEKGVPDKDPSESLENFLEFFVVTPVDLDPNGIMRKYERILSLGEERFKRMAQVIAPKADGF